MRTSLLGAGVVALTAFGAIAAERGSPVGSAAAVTPSAAAAFDGSPRDLARDGSILFGDVVSTTVSGNAAIAFEDDTRLYVAERSEVSIDRYIYPGSGGMVVNFAKGVLRLASGRMGGEAISIRTSVAEIGLRGTVVSVAADGGTTVLFVEQGVVLAQAGGQAVEVQQGQSLTIDAGGAGAPESGWPTALNVAVTAMATNLAVTAAPAVAAPVEVANQLSPADANAAASGLSANDDAFGYN